MLTRFRTINQGLPGNGLTKPEFQWGTNGSIKCTMFFIKNIKSSLVNSIICLSFLYLGKTKGVLACFFTKLSQRQI